MRYEAVNDAELASTELRHRYGLTKHSSGQLVQQSGGAHPDHPRTYIIGGLGGLLEWSK